MTKSKVKALFISFFLAAVTICLSLAFVACKGGDKDDGNYGVGEEGVYYYDKDASTEYLMTLQSGTYMISAEGAKSYAGTYSYDESEKSISFKTDGGESFSASFSDDAMQLAIENTPYTFLKKVNYTVTFVDGSSRTTQSVTYGKQAVAPEKDESRIFIGWYEDSSFTTSYKFDTAVTGDMTLYAYYIDIDSTIANYEVTFVVDGETIYTTETQNGIVYDIPEYSGILGWWVSDTNEEDFLTYRYEGQTLNEATKLFAVKEGSLGASVYDDKITWEATVSSVTVTVDGTTSFTASGNSQVYDFTALGTGVHYITVSGGSLSQELVYVCNGLARVSTFVVYGNVLVYNAVENAQYYCISVTCGNAAHSHEMVYNGSSLTYDFSNCEMGKDGIRFTVYAYGQGFVESVSDTFVYALILDGTSVVVNGSTDIATWTTVAGATGYEIYIGDEYVETVTGNEYSFKYYEQGTEIEISVKPVAPGYYSEMSVAATYVKSTLKTPVISGISDYTITWEEVTGAASYELSINGYLIQITANANGDVPTTYALSNSDMEHIFDTNVISITAIAGSTGTNSQSSDLLYVTDKTMSPAISYKNGTVTWEYVLSAKTYYVDVDGDVSPVEGTNSFDVTFTHSGENVVSVYFDTESSSPAMAQIVITTYAVIFVEGDYGAYSVDTVYVASGDVLVLPEAEPVHGGVNFSGWYTLPTDFDPDVEKYFGDGNEVVSGTVFNGNSTLILYAFWTATSMDLTLDTGLSGVFADGETTADAKIGYGSGTFTLPVPETVDATKMFIGWYSEPNGGTQYTDSHGSAVTTFGNGNIDTLYAHWITALSFEIEKYAGEIYASVSQGSEIDLAPDGEVTIPATYTEDGETYYVGIINSNAFAGCYNLVTLNVPDTVVYISTTNNGYAKGSGAFASSSHLEYVNVYAVGDDVNTTREITYYSDEAGVLYKKTDDGGAELVYYPYGKSDRSYTIAETVENANEYEISGTNEVKVIRNVTSIAQKVFYSNTSLYNVTVPATVEKVDIQAFQSCTKLQTVTFLDDVRSADARAASVLEIGSKAFQSCSALTEVILPARLSEFNTDIFTSCTKFSSVTITGGGLYSSEGGILYNASKTAVVYCPLGRSEKVTLYSGTTRIEDCAFNGCTKITSIIIPASVTYMGVSAFNGCTGLVSVEFDGTENYGQLVISEKAFYGCTVLEKVVLPVNVITIGENAFAGCKRLTYVYFDCPAGTKAEDLDFAEGAFGTSVTTLEFGANVPLIENFVQIFGTGITTVTIDDKNDNYIEDVFTDDTQSSLGVIYGVYGDGNVILIWTPAINGSYKTVENCTAVAASAFSGNRTLRGIEITAGVTEIGEYAFYGCTSLQTVTFASGSALESIGDFAFGDCSSLTEITVPASVKYMGEYEDGELVAVNVFDGCSSLTKIEVETGNETFASADGILYMKESGIVTQLLVCPMRNAVTAVVLPGQITKIWDRAFYQNATLTSVSFENGEIDGELEFGESVFYGCTSLETVELPTGLTAIPEMLFGYCSSLKTITVPYTVTEIGAEAFYQCTSLETVTFAELPSEADEGTYALTFKDTNGEAQLDGTFYNCTSLTTIALPDRTVALGIRTFANCSSLTTVTLGAGIEAIPDSTFRGCTSLSEIKFGNANGADIKLTTIEGNAFYEAGENASGGITLVLPSSVTTLEDYAFQQAYISSITFNEGLKTIGKYAFGSASSYVNATITSVTLPASLESLDTGSFAYIKSLTQVTFSDGIALKEISDLAFAGTGLTTVSVPAAVTSIGDSAFSGCTALSTVTFLTDSSTGKSSVTSFGKNAFEGCTSLTTFTFPDTASGITLGSAMFDGCTSLSELVFTSGVTSIGTVSLGSALDGSSVTKIDTTNCDTLGTDSEYPVIYTKVNGEIAGTIVCVFGTITGEYTVPTGITTIDDSAFLSQTAITNVSVPQSITSIGASAFSGCSALAAVEFYAVSGVTPSQLTIGSSAFKGTAIADIDFSAFQSVALGNSVFYNNTALTTVALDSNITLVVGTGTTEAKAGSFSKCTGLTTVILNGCTSIPDYTFYSCSALKTIAKTAADAEANPGVFDLQGVSVGLGAIVSTVVEKAIFSETTQIASGTNNVGLASCKSLTTVILNGFTPAGYMFMNCTSLVCLGQTENDLYYNGIPVIDLTGIDTSDQTSTFSGCTAIQAVILDTRYGVGISVFNGCTALTTVALYTESTGITWDTGVAHLEGMTLKNGAFMGAGLTTVYLSSTSSLPTGTSSSGALAGAFTSCASLATVDLGGLASVPGFTFYGCKLLVKVTNTADVTAIGASAFYNCNVLTTFGATENLIDAGNVTSLGASAFYGCAEITTVILGQGVEIGVTTFSGCTKLEALATSQDGLYVDGKPVVDLTGLLLTATDSTTTGGRAFKDCKAIQTLILGDVTTIGVEAFNGCTNLSTIAKDVSSIEWGTADVTSLTLTYKAAFYGCGMEKVILSSTITLTAGTSTSGSSGAFSDCLSLKYVDLGGLTSVPARTFYDCSALEEIALGNCLDIGESAFYGCTSLTTVYKFEDDKIEGVANLSGLTLGKGSFGNTGIVTAVADSTTIFTDGSNYGTSNTAALGNNTKLTTVILGVSKVPAYAFCGCTALTTLAIDADSLMEGVINLEGLDASGDYLFYNCSAIAEARLGDNKVLGKGTFYGCSSLVTVGDSFQVADLSGVTMGLASFSNTAIVSLVLSDTSSLTAGSGTTYSTAGVFSACKSLTYVEFGGLTEIPNYAFYDCEALEKISGSDYITVIGNYAFYKCLSLATVGDDENVVSLGSIETIGTNAFESCTAVTTLLISDALDSVGASAFASCSAIETVYYAGDVESWEDMDVDSSNTTLTSAKIYFYSEDEPEDTENSYWHYEDGVVTVWETTEFPDD